MNATNNYTEKIISRNIRKFMPRIMIFGSRLTGIFIIFSSKENIATSSAAMQFVKWDFKDSSFEIVLKFRERL